MRARAFLQQNRRRRLEQGHMWVYKSEVQHVEGDVAPGDLVDLVNHKGVYLATAYANPNSQIFARILSYDKNEVIDEAFFQRRILAAKAHRDRFLPNVTSYRAVYGESDFLPGLIVDKYGDVLVVQILAYGMERHMDLTRNALIETFQPAGMFLRNDVPVRKLEGLPLTTEVWYGEVPREIEIEENGFPFLIDVYEGQKTGYFFDQRENRKAILPLMKNWKHADGISEGAEVLECFCHTGAFTVHALQYGAKHVTAVDISDHAIEVAEKNVSLNQSSSRATLIAANAFDFLRDEERDKKQYDVVILDPPAFAKSRRALDGALRGYKEINLRGLKLVREGGYLVTASCSYHLSPELFKDVIQKAAVDAHCVLKQIHWSSAGYDHPELAGAEEGHYLKFAIYQVFHRA